MGIALALPSDIGSDYALPVIREFESRASVRPAAAKDSRGWPHGPFSTKGRDIVNSRGDVLTWAGVNWPMSGLCLMRLEKPRISVLELNKDHLQARLWFRKDWNGSRPKPS